MKRDPLAEPCEVCEAGPGVLCPTPTGLHWARAKAAGMSPDEMLAWRPAEGRPAEGRPAEEARPAETLSGAGIALAALAEDLGIALTALETACNIAEQHGAPVAEVEQLRKIGRMIGDRSPARSETTRTS